MIASGVLRRRLTCAFLMDLRSVGQKLGGFCPPETLAESGLLGSGGLFR